MTAALVRPTTGSAVRPATGAPTAGATDLGRIDIGDQVVAKVAARAAVEVPDAGGAAPRLLGRSGAGGGALGVRRTGLDTLPKASAQVDGSTVVLNLDVSVRWPASIPAVTAAVRERVAARVTQLTGLAVTSVSISVTDLVTPLPPPPRVR